MRFQQKSKRIIKIKSIGYIDPNAALPNLLRDALFPQFRGVKRTFVIKSCSNSLKLVKTCIYKNQSRPRLGLARKLTDSHHKNGNTNLIEYLCHHFNHFLAELKGLLCVESRQGLLFIRHMLRTRLFSRWYLRQTLSLIDRQSLKKQQTSSLQLCCINSKEYYEWNLGRDFSFFPIIVWFSLLFCSHCCFAEVNYLSELRLCPLSALFS